mgnify:CR=1 FL=1
MSLPAASLVGAVVMGSRVFCCGYFPASSISIIMVPGDVINLYVKGERAWEQNREQMWNGESTLEHSYLCPYVFPQDWFTYIDVGTYEH